MAPAIRPAGYFNAKARKLAAIACFVQEAGGLDMLRARADAPLRAELLGVHGVGAETADAILCYALDQPAFVADAYSRRVLGRVGVLPEEAGRSYERARAYLLPRLPRHPAWLGEFHALLVAVGKEWCRPANPRCALCPLCARCLWARKHAASDGRAG